MIDRKEKFENEHYLSKIDGYPERNVDWFKEHIFQDVVLQLKDKKIFLDVGCAYGYYTVLFEDVFEKIIGLDFAENRIKFASNNCRSENIEFVCSKIEEFKNDFKFDSMFTSMVFQHIPKNDKIDAFKTLHTLATDNCKFLMYDFNWGNEDITDDWVAPVSPQWIHKYIDDYWECESCEEFVRESEGDKGMMYRYILRKVII